MTKQQQRYIKQYSRHMYPVRSIGEKMRRIQGDGTIPTETRKDLLKAYSGVRDYFLDV